MMQQFDEICINLRILNSQRKLYPMTLYQKGVMKTTRGQKQTALKSFIQKCKEKIK